MPQAIRDLHMGVWRDGIFVLVLHERISKIDLKNIPGKIAHALITAISAYEGI